MENLNKKWNILTEGIEEKERRAVTEAVLENSAKYMIDNQLAEEADIETLLEGGEVAPSNSGATTPYVIPKVMLPVIRRVMPQLIAHEIVSVQPIQGRKGVIFYAKYEYTDAKGGITAGQEYTMGNFSQDEVNNRDIAGQPYYTSEKIGPYSITIQGSAAVGADPGPEAAEVASFNKFTFEDAFLTTKLRLTGVEVYDADGGPALPATVPVNATTDGEVEVTLANAVTLKDGDDYLTKEFIVYVLYNMESEAKIPEMQFTIDNQDVLTKERKLRIRFTQEAVQDLKSHYGLNLEQELVKMASIQMNYEIDRELIQFIERSVDTNLKFNHNWNFSGVSNIVQFLDRHRALAQSIFGLAGKVAQFNRQGAANWAIVSPKVAAILSMLPEFSKDSAIKSPNIYTVGSMSKIKYFVDPNRIGNDEDTILLGFKNNISSFGAGVVYSPYANWMTPNILDPDTFDTNKGFFSRYAITLAPRGQYFYAKLTINNLPALGANVSGA